MTFSGRMLVVASVLTVAASPAWAAGKVTGVSVDKPIVGFGDSLYATVSGTIMKDFFGRGCMVRVSLKYADNTIEVVHPSFAVDSFPVTGFYLQPSKLGTVKVIADGGPPGFLGWPSCTGSAQTSVSVRIKLPPVPIGIPKPFFERP